MTTYFKDVLLPAKEAPVLKVTITSEDYGEYTLTVECLREIEPEKRYAPLSRKFSHLEDAHAAYDTLIKAVEWVIYFLVPAE